MSNAVLSVPMVFNYNGTRLFKSPEELKNSELAANKVPVFLNHKSSALYNDQVGTAKNLTWDEVSKRLLVSIDTDDDKIEALVPGFKKMELIPISGEYDNREFMTPGEFDGQRFDGVQRDIVWNAISLIVPEEGMTWKGRCPINKCHMKRTDADAVGIKYLARELLTKSKQQDAKTVTESDLSFDPEKHMLIESHNKLMAEANSELEKKGTTIKSYEEEKRNAVIKLIVAKGRDKEEDLKDKSIDYLNGILASYAPRKAEDGSEISTEFLPPVIKGHDKKKGHWGEIGYTLEDKKKEES